MQYEKLPDEKTPVQQQEQAPIQVSKSDIRENAEVKKSRTIVLVLLSLQLVFALFYLIEQSIALGFYNAPKFRVHNYTITSALIGNVVIGAVSVVYLIIFIIVVARYLRIPILVFAWLAIVELAGTLIVFILATIAVIVVATTAHSARDPTGTALNVVVMILALFAVVCIIVTLIYAFKLARLLKQQQMYQSV